MAGFSVDRPRQVVPRWRPSDESARRGELAPLRTSPVPRFSEEMVADGLADWRSRPTLSVASDLVSAAFTLGLDRVAVDAAQFVHTHPATPPAARDVAALYLRRAGLGAESTGQDEGNPGGPLPSGRILTPTDRQSFAQIRRIRGRLIEYPRDPFLWSDLARCYLSLGVPGKAERAMRSALGLAPEDRFILRAAARFYLHQGEKDRAHRLLAGCGALRSDPWIMAGEIAVADALNQPPRFIKVARRMLDSGHYSPLQLSELASALGTLEVKAGKAKPGRKLIESSLAVPTENAVAQASWVARTFSLFHLPASVYRRSPEADAWAAWQDARWAECLRVTDTWLGDQPFSSRPAIHGSFIASALIEDYDRALGYARVGLRSNPDDPTLMNNYAFASALRGDVREAEAALRRVDIREVDASHQITFAATGGLVAFRAGDAVRGRLLYGEAIRLAQRRRDRLREGLARVYLAFEECRNRSPDAEELRQAALLAAAPILSQSWGHVIVERLRNYRPEQPTNR